VSTACVELKGGSVGLALHDDALEHAVVVTRGGKDAADAFDRVEVRVLERVAPPYLRGRGLTGNPRPKLSVRVDLSSGHRIGQPRVEIGRRIRPELEDVEIMNREHAGRLLRVPGHELEARLPRADAADAERRQPAVAARVSVFYRSVRPLPRSRSLARAQTARRHVDGEPFELDAPEREWRGEQPQKSGAAGEGFERDERKHVGAPVVTQDEPAAAHFRPWEDTHLQPLDGNLALKAAVQRGHDPIAEVWGAAGHQ
jgi:hypothetical protein